MRFRCFRRGNTKLRSTGTDEIDLLKPPGIYVS
jgi:hypothetical protein